MTISIMRIFPRSFTKISFPMQQIQTDKLEVYITICHTINQGLLKHTENQLLQALCFGTVYQLKSKA